MKSEHEWSEDEPRGYEGQLRGLRSYVRELKETAAAHGTEPEHFEHDLTEAEHNIKYYEDEVARIKGQLGKGSDGATYFVYRDAASEWRWQLRAANHRIIADSGEGYRDRADCLHGISLVKNSKDAPV